MSWPIRRHPANRSSTETQPAGYPQGIDAVGTAGGSLVATDQFSVALGQGVNGLNYNYGEQPPPGGSVSMLVGTIGRDIPGMPGRGGGGGTIGLLLITRFGFTGTGGGAATMLLSQPP